MTYNTTAIAILLVSFLVMVFLRFPIAYAVAISAIFCLTYQGLPLSTLVQQMVKGISSFSLMAVPFFITMGVLMGSGGISEKLLNLADALVGWMTGGLAMVNIVASLFFGGISGSASADTASLGSLEIPRACSFPRPTTWSFTQRLPAAFRSARCSSQVTCRAACSLFPS